MISPFLFLLRHIKRKIIKENEIIQQNHFFIHSEHMSMYEIVRYCTLSMYVIVNVGYCQ